MCECNRYKKKPSINEAIRYGGDLPIRYGGYLDILDAFGATYEYREHLNHCGKPGCAAKEHLMVKTYNCWHPVHEGDWLIKTPQGCIYTCTDESFQANYEPVPPEGYTAV